MPVDGFWTLKSTAVGTRLTFEGVGDLRGALRLASPLVARVLSRRFLQYHRRLKRLVEAEGTSLAA